MEFSVKVTHISSPSLFYVQLSHKQKCIEDLTNKYAISAQHAIVPISVEIGKMYIVQYTDENADLSKWYRGRVENKLVAGLQTLYEVFFIDYGNSLVVSLNKIREIKNVFANDPNFAYQCRLHGILSARGCWDDTILKDMLDFINCQYDLKMFVVNNNKGILDVSLYSHNGSLSEFLIYIGYARKESIEQSHDRYLRSSKDTPISSSIQNFCKNKRFNVSVTNINNPENMYCRLDEYKDIISNLETGMTRKYDKSDTKQFIFNPEIGMFCAALLVINGNNKWRRAKIIEIPCNGTIQVFAIDYGFTEFVDWRCIRKLHSNYRSIDAQAIKIALSDIKPIDSEKWSETAIEFLQNELNNKITSMEVNQKSTNMLSVSLYQCDIDEEICVNALLIEKGLAISTGEKSQQLKFEKKTKVNCYQEMSSSMIMDGKYWIGVTIVYVESPGCFYVAPLKWNDKQDKFTKELMHYYSDESSPEKEWDINSICIVKSNEDHLFYRAIVTDNLTNGKYKVFLKDIVRTEIISTKDMFVLDDQFAIHDFTIKCRLANMIPCGGSENWSQSSKEYFQEIIELYSHLFITKSDEISDKILPVDLVAKWEDNKGPLNAATIHKTHLNALFIEAGLAIPTKSNKNESNLITPEISEIQYSFGNLAAEDIESPIETEEEPLEFLGTKLTKWLSPYRLKESHFKGWPSYVDLDGIIYIQTAKSKAMLSNIRRVHDNYFKRKTFDKNHVWNCGDLCTVQYHLDKSFYRGTVIETTPDGKIIVQLIDFGNIEECTPEELRTEILMIEQPALAIKCALANVYPKTENKKWPINVLDMLHAAIVEKECEIFLENEDYYEDQLPEITVIINNICINSTIMDWDWRKIKKEGIIDQINDETSDDESNIIIKNEIEVNDEDVDVLLEKEVTYTFVQLPNNIDKFNGVVVGFIDFQSALVEPDFIQNLMNDTAEQFQKMLFDINHYAPHLQKVIDPVIGLPCIALYGSDNCWYRAEILNIDRNEIKVLFVDYGNIDIIPIDDVKEIKEEWLEFSVQMLKCKISGIQLGLYKDNLEVMLLMKEEIEGKHVICEIQENQFHLEVILKLESDPETLAYQKLLDDGSVLECH